LGALVRWRCPRTVDLVQARAAYIAHQFECDHPQVRGTVLAKARGPRPTSSRSSPLPSTSSNLLVIALIRGSETRPAARQGLKWPAPLEFIEIQANHKNPDMRPWAA